MSIKGLLAEFGLPTANAGLDQITLGADGQLWFTESLTNRIGRITNSGSVSEFVLPGANNGPSGIVAGIDGRQMHIDQANFVFKVNNIEKSKYKFIKQNIFERQRPKCHTKINKTQTQ